MLFDSSWGLGAWGRWFLKGLLDARIAGLSLVCPAKARASQHVCPLGDWILSTGGMGFIALPCPRPSMLAQCSPEPPEVL